MSRHERRLDKSGQVPCHRRSCRSPEELVRFSVRAGILREDFERVSNALSFHSSLAYELDNALLSVTLKAPF
jgi:hypothetical protein